MILFARTFYVIILTHIYIWILFHVSFLLEPSAFYSCFFLPLAGLLISTLVCCLLPLNTGLSSPTICSLLFFPLIQARGLLYSKASLLVHKCKFFQLLLPGLHRGSYVIDLYRPFFQSVSPSAIDCMLTTYKAKCIYIYAYK